LTTNHKPENNQDKDLRMYRDFLEDIHKETKQTATKDEFYTWTEHYNNWIDIIRPFVKAPLDSETANSMVFFRFMELQYNILWVHICVLFGRHHSAMRELRYSLESMTQAYYLDSEHPRANAACKLEIIREIDRERFARIVDDLDIDHKQSVKSLYSDLSQYVRSTYQELRPAFEAGGIWKRVAFGFEYDMFQKCVEMTNRVLDVAYYIMMIRFPAIISKLADDPMTLKSLEDHQSTLALDYFRFRK
jgi:hypothetical protein